MTFRLVVALLAVFSLTGCGNVTQVVVKQIEQWLATAQPVSVQLPPPPNPPIVANANPNPAVLEL